MTRSRLARNIAANLGGQLGLLVLALVAARLVYSRLGQDALGIILFVQTVNLVLAGVLDLGISSITVREVAAHVDDDPEYVRDLVRTASSFYWGGFVLIAAVIVLTAPWVAVHWIHLQTMNTSTATTVLQVLGAAALTALPRALYISLFRGVQRMGFNNAIDAGVGLTQQLGTVAILAFGGGLFAVVFWLAAMYGVAILSYLVIVPRVVPARALIPGWSPVVIKRNARFSGHMMSISALAAIHTYIDKLVVSKLLTVATVGWYTFATSIVARGALFAAAVGDAAYPSLSRLFHANSRAAMLAEYRVLQDLVCFVTLPLYAGIVFLSLPAFSAVFGEGVAHALLLPVAVLCLGYYMNGTLVMPYVYSLAVGKPHITSRFSLAALFIVVPVTVASVAVFGVTGATLGYLSYHLFFYVVGIPRYARDCLERPAREWYQHVARPIGAGMLTYGTAWLVAWRAAGLSTAALVVGLVLASIAFTLITARVANPELRAHVLRWLRLEAVPVVPRQAA